jgi:uncharacterized protein YcfJ
MKPLKKSGREADPTSDRDADVAGTTFGAAGGAIVGGVAGSLAGPGGTVIGALAGAVAGGVIGKVVGAGGWADNENYWREHFHEQAFYKEGLDYRDYDDAFRFGHEKSADAGHLAFDENDPSLRAEWEKGGGHLPWDEARHAAKAAWERNRRGG